MAEVAFDLEFGIEPIGQGVTVLQPASEFTVQGLVRQIGDVGGHACHGQPLRRVLSLVQVIAPAPVGIGHDGLAPDFVKGDVLGRMVGGGGDRDRCEQPLGVFGSPFQDLHATHRAAGDGKKLVDAQVVQ